MLCYEINIYGFPFQTTNNEAVNWNVNMKGGIIWFINSEGPPGSWKSSNCLFTATQSSLLSFKSGFHKAQKSKLQWEGCPSFQQEQENEFIFKILLLLCWLPFVVIILFYFIIIIIFFNPTNKKVKMGIDVFGA